jgi:hypothetical protein
MPTSNNYQYPKGYALCIGINNFTHQRKLEHCISDVEFWGDFFKNSCSFDVVRTLKNEQATNASIFKGMWCLASYAQPGDIVAITFSTHGIAGATHTLCSHNDIINDNEFLFFLKAFKPGVRVVVVTDACQSSGYVGSGSGKKLSEHNKNRVFQALDNGSEALNFKLNELIRTSNDLQVTCHVGHFASASSEANVGDGLLVKYTKSMGFYGLDWYEIGQWREKMEEMFRAGLNPIVAFINEIKNYSAKSNEVKKIVDARMKKAGYSDIDFYLNVQLLTLSTTLDLVNDLRRARYADPQLISGTTQDRYGKILDIIKDDSYYRFTRIPVLTFHGKKSPAFQKQYVFAKKSPAFQSENQ